MQAIKQLHPDIIANVQSKTLFSKEEETLLGTVLSVSTQRSRVIIPPLPERGGGYTVLPLSVCPSKIFFVAFYSVTVDGRNLIFGHKRHIGTSYRGKRFWTHQIPTSCLPILLIFIHI